MAQRSPHRTEYAVTRGATSARVAQAGKLQDGELLQRISHRDSQALAELYDRYATVMFSLIMAIVNRQELAEQVMQEVFQSLWNKPPALKHAKASLEAWLVIMARQYALSRIQSPEAQSHKRLESEPDSFEMTESCEQTALDALDLPARFELMNRVFAELPAAHREVIRIAYLEGRTYVQITQQLQMPLATVKTCLHEGMLRLQKSLCLTSAR